MTIHEAIIAFLGIAVSLASIGEFVIALMYYLHDRKDSEKKSAPSVGQRKRRRRKKR